MILKKTLKISTLILFIIGISYFSAVTLKRVKFNENVSSTYDFEVKNNHGKYQEYYSNGLVKSIDEYENGIRDGISISFHENGDTSSVTNYINGYKHGLSKLYSSSGELVEVEEYKLGTMVLDTILNDSLYKYDLYAFETGAQMFTTNCESCHNTSEFKTENYPEKINLDTIHVALIDSMVLDSAYFSNVTPTDVETLVNYISEKHQKEKRKKIPFLVYRKKYTRKI